MIRLEDVAKRYGATVALKGVSFAVERGEVVGLVGPNGAGKSTALRILTGFLRPDRGHVWIDDIDGIEHRAQAARRIGYLPEGPPLYPDMRVDEYLVFRAQLKGASRAEAKQRCTKVMERVAITERRRTLVGRLSRGYRQRVGLADALIADPGALVLDEPTSGLDPVQVRELRALLVESAVDRAVLLSSHALADLESVATRLVVLADGAVVGDGTPGELRATLGLPAQASLEDVFVAATSKNQPGDGDGGDDRVGIVASSGPAAAGEDARG